MNGTTGELFFDRCSEAFEVILHYYQSGGEIVEIPKCIPLAQFIDELKFFQLGETVIDQVEKVFL